MKPRMSLSHAAVRAADAERLAAFYRDVLGLPEAFRMLREDGSTGIIYLDAGPECFLEVLAGGRAGGGDGGGGAPRAGLAHLCLAVADLAAELARLAALGVRPVRPPIRGGDGNRQAWLADPEGNQVELMELAPSGLQLAYRSRTAGRE